MFTSPRRPAPRTVDATTVETATVEAATVEATVAPAPRSRRRFGRIGGMLAAAAMSVGLIGGFVQPAVAYTPAQMAQLIVNEINAERRLNHLPPVAMSYRLNAAAQSHNTQMAHYNTMSHQLAGEASLGQRISRTTFPWSFCAENIAWTSSMGTQGALAVHRAMYNEKAPNNGHRLNILSRNVNYVGVHVILDNTHRKLWITEDFAHLR